MAINPDQYQKVLSLRHNLETKLVKKLQYIRTLISDVKRQIQKRGTEADVVTEFSVHARKASFAFQSVT